MCVHSKFYNVHQYVHHPFSNVHPVIRKIILSLKIIMLRIIYY